jgi:hypothetical protein
MSPVDILADVRLALRGTSEPVPDPLPAIKARRKASTVLEQADAGAHVWAYGMGVRRERRKYWVGPLGPFTRREALAELVDIGSFRW